MGANFFKGFKMKINRDIGAIKVLRTGEGGEYTSNMSEKFCVEHDIDHEVTAPYTP